MELDCQDCAFELAQAQVLRLRAGPGVTLRCDGGIAWVTQEGVARDDFLRAGESLRIVSSGVTLVEAIGNAVARLALQAGAVHAPAVLRARLDVITKQPLTRKS